MTNDKCNRISHLSFVTCHYLDFLQITIKQPKALLNYIKKLYFCSVVVIYSISSDYKGWWVKKHYYREKRNR